MTMTELIHAVLDIMPDAVFDEGENGEIIIATGLVPVGDPDTQLISVEELNNESN